MLPRPSCKQPEKKQERESRFRPRATGTNLNLPFPLIHVNVHVYVHTHDTAPANSNSAATSGPTCTTATTDPPDLNGGHLSPRALEKQPVRDAPQLSPDTRHYISKPLPPPPPPPPARPPVESRNSYRRSFLEVLLPRQYQKKVLPPDTRSATSRVLNPINYVPRPTPVRVQPERPGQIPQLDTGLRGVGEVNTLLSLPEQRRSRQHSPTDPIVEHSPHLTPTGDRKSVALPANLEPRGTVYATESSAWAGTAGLMVDLEKQDPSTNGIKQPEKAQTIATSRNNAGNTTTQQGSSVLAQSYGVNPLDQPLQPPRRITSHKSLKRAQSTASIHSAGFPNGRTYADPTHPPTTGASQSDAERGLSRHDGTEDDDDDGGVAEELAWGPSHPCFPHVNPHVPLNSREYTATRIIRVRRDWMVAGDLAPTFSNIYPEILDPLMQEVEFRYVIEHINQTLCQAYDPFSAWNWFDGILGVLTGWFWEDFRPWGIKGALNGLEEWLEDWNHTVGARDGVKIIPLRRTGYLCLDVQIPDPQVRIVGEDESQARPNTGGEGTAPPTAKQP
ncbi:hypothetical protein A1O7_03550 [Cladophialophora yegresii CBS 114405]|uniref:Ras modification protein ERF4 n=1 Tax=Cladophialophora yegresii CBS 114405 TaxID=1182544 RepID=W9WDN0_9EURO|nr:uncharacterized protein A1O7_03550 [Cladophialophora yegresii CBS 114405]EXJ63105.1 hypothetical protein A1O7_03550 [Cladophialophora yegresii CBS 114405]